MKFLAMELVPALAERIARGALPLADALVIARDTCSALEAVHDKGVVAAELTEKLR